MTQCPTLPDAAQLPQRGTLRCGSAGRRCGGGRKTIGWPWKRPLEFQLHHPALGWNRRPSAPPCALRATMRPSRPDCCTARGSSTTHRTSMRSSRARAGRMSSTCACGRGEDRGARRRGASRPARAAGCAAPPDSMRRSRAPRPPESPARPNVELPCCCVCRHACAQAQTRFGDTGGIHAAALFDFSGYCWQSPRMSAVTMPSTSWSARACWPGEPPADRPHRAVERPRQLRIGAKGAARGRGGGARRHRRSIEPGGQSGRRRAHAGGIPARITAISMHTRSGSGGLSGCRLEQSLRTTPGLNFSFRLLLAPSQFDASLAPCADQLRLDFTASKTFG